MIYRLEEIRFCDDTRGTARCNQRDVIMSILASYRLHLILEKVTLNFRVTDTVHRMT
jgi:hypothetical protein